MTYIATVDDNGVVSVGPEGEPAHYLMSHQAWEDLHSSLATIEPWKTAGKWRAVCADAVARINWNGHIWKQSRLELGLLILDGKRTRAGRDAMARAILGR